MTEYDYSPEAYQRHLATQQRIAKWVDKSESCRPHFANPLAPPPTHLPGYEPPEVRSGGHSPHRGQGHGHGHHRHHRCRSPSPDSSEDEAYDRGGLYAPGPMPPMRSAPGHLGTFPQQQMPYSNPMASPPLMSPQGQMPPSYYGTPSIQQVKAQRKQQPPAYRGHAPPPIFVSPPVSPGIYPHPGSPTGYVMMGPQQMAPMPFMSPPLANSAPAQITSFTLPHAPQPPTAPPGGYFQYQPQQQAYSQSFASLLSPPPMGAMQPGPMYAFSTSSAMVSPPHSAFPEMYTFSPMVSPQGQLIQSPYHGIQMGVAPPTSPATSPYSYIYPSPGLHQRVYDMTGQDKHMLRRSIG